MELCQKYNIHLVSDEIYALSVWHNPENPNAVPFTSVLEIDTKDIIDPQLVHVLWGLSKVNKFIINWLIIDEFRILVLMGSELVA
jgi:aspartate/methionine/tyrosine aminotransferase